MQAFFYAERPESPGPKAASLLESGEFRCVRPAWA